MATSSLSRRARILIVLVGLVALAVEAYALIAMVGVVFAVTAVGHYLSHPHGAGTSHALRVREGQAFTLDRQRVHAGWRVRHRGGRLYVEGVTFTGEDDSVNGPEGSLELRFVGPHAETLMECTSADSLEPGSPNYFVCPPVPEPAGGIDHIEVRVGHDAGY